MHCCIMSYLDFYVKSNVLKLCNGEVGGGAGRGQVIMVSMNCKTHNSKNTDLHQVPGY